MIYTKLFNGDCIDIIGRDVEHNSIDMVLTSPPYDNLRSYNGYRFDYKEVLMSIYKSLKNGGVCVWVVGDSVRGGSKTGTSYKQALYAMDIGFKLYDVIIYEKAGTAPPHKNRYFNAFEYMFVFSKGKPKTVNLLRDKKNKWGGTSTFADVTRRQKDGTLTNIGRKTINEYGVRTNIWRYANGKGFSTKDSIAYKHPAIFPEQLAKDHILTWTNEGDVVLDPMCGSGTTLKMCKVLNRNSIGIDISNEYIGISRERLSIKER